MYPRELAPHLKRLATQFPVITLTGPRQSGKTTLCRLVFKEYNYINLEDLRFRELAFDDPLELLKLSKEKKGLILDEIQRAPDLPSYIQTLVDQTQTPGQFILTGSQQFEVTTTINQSLAGRTAILRLLPLAYSELYSNSLPALDDIIYSGFYPRIHDKHLNPSEALSFYLSTYVERDLRNLINIKNLATFERFLRLCATQIGRLLNYSRLANDCGITVNTVKEWLWLLEASYILFQVQPHFENFRKRLTKSTKLYFIDVGLAAYLLGISSASNVQSHPLKGELFENFIVCEFLKNRYNHVKDNNLYFYRDHIGNEVDLVLDYGNELVTVEIKSGSTVSRNYFKGLDFYHELAGTKNHKRLVIYAGDESYEWSGETRIFSFHDLSKVFEFIQ